MATKTDHIAAKQRRQKIILIAGGVILAALVVIQGPKLMDQLKGSSKSSAAPATTTPTTTTPGVATPGATTGGTTTPAVATGSGQTAQVAGVVIRPAGPPAAGTGQLWSLSRFKVKDPFVQQVGPKSSSGASAPATTTAPGATPGASTGSTGGVAAPTTQTPVSLGYATLMVNGKPQQLQLKQVFPKGQPTFVLVSVEKASIKIGVAGGKFTGGGAVKLDFGKAVTLMNTTTGQRFVMKLVFTGDQPEQIAAFKAPVAGTTQTTTGQTTSASTP